MHGYRRMPLCGLEIKIPWVSRKDEPVVAPLGAHRSSESVSQARADTSQFPATRVGETHRPRTASVPLNRLTNNLAVESESSQGAPAPESVTVGSTSSSTKVLRSASVKHGSVVEYSLPFLQPVPGKTKSDQHYSDWNLQTVIENHRERFHQFLLHKGGFSSRESAENFLQIVLSMVEKPTPAQSTINALRKAFQELPDAKTYWERNAGFHENIAQQMLETLQGPDSAPAVFPNGKGKPTSMIDVGCGDAKKTAALAEAWGLPPERAIGLDIVGNNSIPKSVKFEKMLPDALPGSIKPNSQELATVSMVCHHSSDPAALLKSIHTALKPGGYLVIRDHNADPKLADFLNTVHIFYDNVYEGKEECMPNVQNYKPLEDWIDIFKEPGFDIVKTQYIPFSTDKDKGDPKNTGDNFTCVLKKQ